MRWAQKTRLLAHFDAAQFAAKHRVESWRASGQTWRARRLQPMTVGHGERSCSLASVLIAGSEQSMQTNAAFVMEKVRR